MDAHEQEIDSINLKYSWQSGKYKNGERDFVKGVFAQKLSDGYLLLDEKFQRGKVWDDNQPVEGILRAYNGLSTRYFEHNTNKNGHHTGDIHKDHKPIFYKSIKNPYYRVWHLNYKTRFTDLLKDPNAMTSVHGEEVIDGIKTTKIAFKSFNGSYDCYLWLLPEMNYLPIKFQSFAVADGRTIMEMRWKEYKKFASNIWYPMEIIQFVRNTDNPNIMKVEMVEFSPLTKKDFEFTFPPSTHVTDHIRGTSYLIED